MNSCLLVFAALIASIGLVTTTRGAEQPAANPTASAETLPTMRRRPSALVAVDSYVWVAHQSQGSLSVVDPVARRVVCETAIGKSLTSLAAAPAQQLVFAVDAGAHELIALDARAAERPSIIGKAKLEFDPIEIVVADDQQWAAVASRWSRRVAFLSWRRTMPATGGPSSIELQASSPIDLPFAPRRMAVVPDGRHVIVADGFGGSLAVVDRERRRVARVVQLSGHHIDGLARSHDGRSLVAAHQILNGREITDDDPVFWGALLNNALQSFAWEDLLSSSSRGRDDEPVASAATPKLLDRGLLLPLGEPGHGTGDPGAVWIGKDGRTIVCLAGVDELAVRPNAHQPMVRRTVGRRPVALAAHEEAGWAVVANQLDDSLSVLDLDTLQPRGVVSLGPQPGRTLVDEGERLFHDARLSLDGWFSCHSCHIDGHSNHLVNDNFGDDSQGAPKRVPSLLGTAKTAPWAWNGSQFDLSNQIAKSLVHTMRGGARSAESQRVEALRAYVESLRPTPSLTRARRQRDAFADDSTDAAAPLARAGRAVFVRERCAECHAGEGLTHSETFDVGLRDEHGASRFNPPSLVGVSQRDAFLHDARAKRLEEVFLHVGHPHETPWSAEDVAALVAYLETL